MLDKTEPFLSPLCPSRPTMAAGALGARGAHVPERVVVECNLPSGCATTLHRATTGVTAPGREPSTGHAMSHHAHHRVSAAFGI